MNIIEGYDFDDLYLIPQPSDVNSRDDVNLSVTIYSRLPLKIPIIASPMKGIISVDMIKEMDRLGGIGILHRFYTDIKDRARDIYTIAKECTNWGVAVGLNDGEEFWAADLGAKIICVDVANGYLDSVKKYCERVANYLATNNYDSLLMAGNVVTREGADDLNENGVDLVRVGIGSGGLCSTRDVTGVGYPQLSAIANCSDDSWIVADGGINTSGRAVKALAAGADLIMLGSILGRCKESSHNGIIYGMASQRLQEEYYHNTKSIEGREKEIVKDTTLEELISSFIWGIKSGCTYLGARNLAELYLSATWVKA